MMKALKTIATIVAVVAIGGSIVWLAGEQHRENCIREGKQACSVLPWNAGKTPPADHRNATRREFDCYLDASKCENPWDQFRDR
jgi:hypothetical protein